MGQDEIRVLLARLHDNHNFTINKLSKMIPTLDKTSLGRLVREGRVLYQTRGIARLTMALLN